MADFIHPGWSLYIAVVTVVSIVACFLLAMLMSKRRQPGEKVDTTGHVWDGDLRELNNPLPRWWLYLFYITCAFGLAYLVLYPGLGSFQGVLGWSQTGQYDREIDQAKARFDPLFAEFLAKDIPTVAGDPRAREMGERLFLTYCVQCHGSDARGSRGFPNLTDKDWLWGGDPEAIRETIVNGRTGVMPPMAAAIGGGANVEQVAHYVLRLSNSAHDPVKAELGRPAFEACAACHGPDGKGNPLLGAPNLTDRIWLYGGSLATVMDTINRGRTNQMPAFGELLGEGKVHVLAAYVWGLSNTAPNK
jgi:cytochrome c oxidase cbb3-type subunit 3